MNDILFKLLLISLPKLRIKEPASKRLPLLLQIVDNTKSPYNNKKKSKAINFRRERRHREEASGTLRLHERMTLSRREASLRPARAWCSRGHFGTFSVRSKLPPLYMPVSPLPVSRETSRDLWRSIEPSTMGVFKLRTSVSAHPLCPKYSGPFNVHIHL